MRSAAAFGFETFVLMTWGVWRAGGLMLIGMAVFKLGVLSAERPPLRRVPRLPGPGCA